MPNDSRFWQYKVYADIGGGSQDSSIGVTIGDVGSGVADCDQQNIWNLQKNWIFRRRYIVGILRNKANISI